MENSRLTQVETVFFMFWVKKVAGAFGEHWQSVVSEVSPRLRSTQYLIGT